MIEPREKEVEYSGLLKSSGRIQYLTRRMFLLQLAQLIELLSKMARAQHTVGKFDRSSTAFIVIGAQFYTMYRPEWDTYFMLQAEIAKLRSNCVTRHIGAVIVKDNRQIATGYNGTPPGIKNCFEGGCPRCMDRVNGRIKSGEGLERCLCTHAEANAIMQCALFGNAGSTKGATIYTTFAPCIECSKMAISVGITKIVVLADYPEDGTGLLKEANVKLSQLNVNDLKPWISLISNDSENFAKLS